MIEGWVRSFRGWDTDPAVWRRAMIIGVILAVLTIIVGLTGLALILDGRNWFVGVAVLVLALELAAGLRFGDRVFHGDPHPYRVLGYGLGGLCWALSIAGLPLVGLAVGTVALPGGVLIISQRARR